MTNGNEGQDAPDSAGPAVATTANKCLESFQVCLLQASIVHARELSMVEDQVARFSTWAAAIGVFAPERASMDHRLRYAADVRNVVNGLLESLNYRIETCSDILDATGKNKTTASLDVQDESLKRSFVHIGTEISHLNRISNTIRRATKDVQLQKAGDFQIKDDEGNDLEPFLTSIFKHHIRDRFPDVSENIQQRLVRAMILRRKRILHRKHRQGLTSIRLQKTIPKAPISMPALKQTLSLANVTLKHGDEGLITSAPTVAPSLVQSATTLDPKRFQKVSSSPSIISASQTVALGNHETLVFPPSPGLSSKQKYEHFCSQQVADSKTGISPNANHESEYERKKRFYLEIIGEIACPYCLYALPADIVFSGRKWENHVKNDLDPYICLFEDCDQPDVLFTHGDEWRSHMEQHRKFWRCSSHREMGSFSTRDEYVRHMREDHGTTLSDTRLRTLANRNARKMAKLFPMCPLCGKDESVIEGPLESHITGHLRSLALKSLPSYQEDIPDGVGNDRVSASADDSRPLSRSTIKQFNIDKDAFDIPTGSVDLLEQANESNIKNFLGEAHLYLHQIYEGAWDATCYEKLGYKKTSGDPEGDKTLQSFLLEKRKKDKLAQSKPEQLGTQAGEVTTEDGLNLDGGSENLGTNLGDEYSRTGAMEWLSENSDEGSKLSTQTSPAVPLLRKAIMEQRGAIDIRATNVDVIHGHLKDGKGPATLMVYEFQFNSRKASRRITAVDMNLTYGSNGAQKPEIMAISPEGRHFLMPTTQTKTTTRGLAFEPSELLGAPDNASLKWEKTVNSETKDAIIFVGYLGFRDHTFGGPNSASWKITEDASVKAGIPASARIAVLVLRGDYDPFYCDFEIKAEMDLVSRLKKVFRSEPQAGTEHYDPVSSPTNNLRTYDVDSLQNVDLESLSLVSFTGPEL